MHKDFDRTALFNQSTFNSAAFVILTTFLRLLSSFTSVYLLDLKTFSIYSKSTFYYNTYFIFDCIDNRA